jgi:hypothetical protein
MVYDNNADLDFTTTHADKLIYFWIATFAPGLIDNLATAPGLRIRVETNATQDTDWYEWDIMYSDLIPSEGNEFFKVYVLDPRAPPTRTKGTPSLTTLRWFGAMMDTNATAKGQNLAIDRISYGFGELIATGTATDAASGLQEMIDWEWGDSDNRWGILSVDPETGKAKCKGKLVIGDGAGALGTTFTAQDTSITWAGNLYYDGTRVRPTVGYDSSNNWTGLKSDGTAYYGVDLRGNGTLDTDVTFGAAVGSDQGRSGPTLEGSTQIPTVFTGDDAAVEDVAIYATTFADYRAIDLSANAATDIMNACTFKSCGTIDIGPVVGRNNVVISSIGGAYTFLERFLNPAAIAAEQLSTADPITEWTDSLNGTDWSVPGAVTGYVELLGGTTRTNLTVLDDDKMGSDDHYVDCIVRFPAAGAGQGTLGPVIACHLTVDDYFWVEVDLASDTIELFRVNTGTATSIDGPDTFTMDEDEDYQILLRRSGTTIEAFASGTSVADGLHTTKLSATDSAHTGTAQRLVGLRGDALAGQTGATGERPRVRLFGAGPITDNLGAIITPATGDWDFEDASFIQCSRALSWDTAGTFSLNSITLSGSLVDAHNDSGGLVTGNVDSGTLAASIENLGASTSSFVASVPVTITALDNDLIAQEGVSIYVQDSAGPFNDTEQIVRELTNVSGVATENYTGSTPLSVVIRGKKKGKLPVDTVGTITPTGLITSITIVDDPNQE